MKKIRAIIGLLIFTGIFQCGVISYAGQLPREEKGKQLFPDHTFSDVPGCVIFGHDENLLVLFLE